MQELKVLSAAATSRDAATELHELEAHKDLAQRHKVIWDEVQRFYTIDPYAKSVDKTILKDRLEKKFPKEDHHKEFFMIIDNLKKVSVPNIVELVREVRLESTSQELAVALADGKYSKADDLVVKYHELRTGNDMNAESGILVAPTYKDLATDAKGEQTFQVFPKQIDDLLGGRASRGHHIFVFARPDVGKTAIALTMCYGFLRQRLKVIYMGNEEPEKDVLLRLKARICDRPMTWVQENLAKADEVCFSRGYGGLTFWSPEDSAGSLKELSQRMKLYKPDVVIVDQLRNMKVSGDSDHVKYEILSQGIRGFGKEYGALTISLGQGGSTAEDKAILDMNDVYGSKTGIQGTADAILGAGATYHMKERGEIIITACKNKLGGNNKSIKLQLDKLRSKVF